MVGDAGAAEDVVQDVFVALDTGCLVPHYADNAAAAMSISRGAVKSHTARGTSALHTRLEQSGR